MAHTIQGAIAASARGGRLITLPYTRARAGALWRAATSWGEPDAGCFVYRGTTARGAAWQVRLVRSPQHCDDCGASCGAAMVERHGVYHLCPTCAEA